MEIGTSIMEMLMDAGYVHDYCNDYGEPGYDKDDENGFIIFGNIWCKKKDCSFTEVYENSREKKIHSIEFHYPRLFKKMEEQGIEFQWYDEWIIDHNNDRAYRTTADSYQWQSSILWTDGDFLTPDDEIEEWVEAVVNDPQKCLPNHIWSDEQLNEIGFEEYQCGYQNGWFPGMTDDPKEISKIIEAEYDEKGMEVDILYKLSYVSQFDLGFCVFVRPVKQGEENDDSN